MSTVPVRVGDHDAEPVAVRSISPRRSAELFAIRNTQWSLPEYRALADRYADAVQAFQIALANEDFAGVRAASLTLHEIANQTAGLNLGIKNALVRAEQESSRDHH